MPWIGSCIAAGPGGFHELEPEMPEPELRLPRVRIRLSPEVLLGILRAKRHREVPVRTRGLLRVLTIAG